MTWLPFTLLWLLIFSLSQFYKVHDAPSHLSWVSFNLFLLFYYFWFFCFCFFFDEALAHWDNPLGSEGTVILIQIANKTIVKLRETWLYLQQLVSLLEITQLLRRGRDNYCTQLSDFLIEGVVLEVKLSQWKIPCYFKRSSMFRVDGPLKFFSRNLRSLKENKYLRF